MDVQNNSIFVPANIENGIFRGHVVGSIKGQLEFVEVLRAAGLESFIPSIDRLPRCRVTDAKLVQGRFCYEAHIFSRTLIEIHP